MALRENIDTSYSSASAKFFWRYLLTPGAYQVDPASELMKLDEDRVGGKRLARPLTLTPELVEQRHRMTKEGAGLRQLGCRAARQPQ